MPWIVNADFMKPSVIVFLAVMLVACWYMYFVLLHLLQLLKFQFSGMESTYMNMFQQASVALRGRKQDKQCTCKDEARLRNHCCHGEDTSISYSEFASVALVIQHAIRTRHIMLSTVVSPGFTILFHVM
jgi:hypothetical protein